MFYILPVALLWIHGTLKKIERERRGEEEEEEKEKEEEEEERKGLAWN
jgi:hypothetical protein